MTDEEEIKLYGADAADWLKRWDEGHPVWSIEMGGLGPGYEQCIQITAAESLRHLLATKPTVDEMQDKEKWPAIRDGIDKALWTNPLVKALGLSGAQAGAGKNLACLLYMKGPRAVMANEQIKDRHIQVQKHFPGIG